MSTDDDLRSLWTDPTRYLLVRLDRVDEAFVIVDRATKNAILIEDQAVHDATVMKMKEAGVEVARVFP